MSNLDKRIEFSIDDYTLQEISDAQLMELEMKVVSEGDNRHGMPITRDAVINSAETIIGKPVLFKFNSYTDDLMGHEVDEIACGVCGLTKDDYYFKEIDGKIWLVVKAYLWKMYFEEVINVFERDKQKAISMEMLIVDSEDEEEDEETLTITEFCFTGVTLLGKIYNPAIPNANAMVTKYSELSKSSKQEYTSMVNATKKLIFANADIPDTPNIAIKEENLVEIFNKKEFVKKYSMTASEMLEKMDGALCGVKYTNGEFECKKYYVRDFCNKFAYARDYETDVVVAIPYSFENKMPKFDFTNVKNAVMRYVVDEENEEGEEAEKDIVQLYADKAVEEVKVELTAKSEEQIKEFSTKIEELEKNNTELTEKVTTFETEITTLKETNDTLETEKKELFDFKETVLAQEKENKVNYAIQTVKDSLNEEQIKEWSTKVDEFETVEAFQNAIQAFAYTQVNQVQKPEDIRIHVPIQGNNEAKGLWD